MESAIFAGMLLHPLAILVLVLIVSASIKAGVEANISPTPNFSLGRLLCAFLGLVLAGIILAAITAYVTPEESKRFGVAPENYISVMRKEFVLISVLIVYLGAIGSALVGMPILLALARRGFATIPMLVVSSIPVSFIAMLVLSSIGGSPPHLVIDTLQIACAHAWLALGFAIGAGLPWRRNRHTLKFGQES